MLHPLEGGHVSSTRHDVVSTNSSCDGGGEESGTASECGIADLRSFITCALTVLGETVEEGLAGWVVGGVISRDGALAAVSSSEQYTEKFTHLQLMALNPAASPGAPAESYRRR